MTTQGAPAPAAGDTRSTAAAEAAATRNDWAAPVEEVAGSGGRAGWSIHSAPRPRGPDGGASEGAAIVSPPAPLAPLDFPLWRECSGGEYDIEPVTYSTGTSIGFTPPRDLFAGRLPMRLQLEELDLPGNDLFHLGRQPSLNQLCSGDELLNLCLHSPSSRLESAAAFKSNSLKRDRGAEPTVLQHLTAQPARRFRADPELAPGSLTAAAAGAFEPLPLSGPYSSEPTMAETRFMLDHREQLLEQQRKKLTEYQTRRQHAIAQQVQLQDRQPAQQQAHHQPQRHAQHYPQLNAQLQAYHLAQHIPQHHAHRQEQQHEQQQAPQQAQLQAQHQARLHLQQPVQQPAQQPAQQSAQQLLQLQAQSQLKQHEQRLHPAQQQLQEPSPQSQPSPHQNLLLQLQQQLREQLEQQLQQQHKLQEEQQLRRLHHRDQQARPEQQLQQEQAEQRRLVAHQGGLAISEEDSRLKRERTDSVESKAGPHFLQLQLHMPAPVAGPSTGAEPSPFSYNPLDRIRATKCVVIGNGPLLRPEPEDDTVTYKQGKWEEREERLLAHIVYCFSSRELKDIAKVANACGIIRNSRAIDKKLKRMVNFTNWRARNVGSMQNVLAELITKHKWRDLCHEDRAKLDHARQYLRERININSLEPLYNLNSSNA